MVQKRDEEEDWTDSEMSDKEAGDHTLDELKKKIEGYSKQEASISQKRL